MERVIKEEEDEEEKRPVEMEEVMSSYEYTQAEIYYKNQKYAKAGRLLNNLSDTLRLTQPGSPSHLLVLKRLYASLVKQKMIKDAELVLMNTKELMNSEYAKKNGYYEEPGEKLGARLDI